MKYKLGEQRDSDAPLHWRKKPVVIEAVRVTDAEYDGHGWKGEPFAVAGAELPAWLGRALKDGTLYVQPGGGITPAVWAIRTTEGIMTAGPGDWIIRGIKGELYPCKPDVFAQTYEPA
jgi:hypothetical protein